MTYRRSARRPFRVRLARALGIACAAVSTPAMAGVIEFPVPGVNPVLTSITAGPDGNVWFADQNVDRIGRISPAGVVTVFVLPAGSSVNQIARGPDGNIWFTELTENKIGRLTPDGGLTEFPVPVPGSGPAGIVTGPDGNLWVTLTSANLIARVTPIGGFGIFPIPTPASGPGNIILGPDGNLWFAQEDITQVARITPAGFVSEFPILGTPSGIAKGADGNLWVTYANRIARMSPAGAVQVIHGVPGILGILGIVPGPDGALWFATFPGGLGRITTSGAITQFPTPRQPFALSTGPDGNLWLTEDEGRIGRVSFNVVATGAGPGGGPHVRVFDSLGGQEILGFFAYDAGFSGGVRVAVGDVNGDGIPDVITGPGPGGGPHVRVFDGFTGDPLPGPVGSFFGFDPGFQGGVTVAAADLNCDGYADVLVGAGQGGGPHMRAFDGRTGAVVESPIADTFAYGPTFTGGVFVAAAGCRR
jgi:streptogramin lyase